MARDTYSREHVDFLRDEYPNMSRHDLTHAFNSRFGMNKTEASIKAALKKHGVKAGRTGAQAMRAKSKGTSKLFTPDQVAFIKDNYAKLGRKGLHGALATEFGLSVTLSQVVSFVKNHKIRSGRTGHFVKGGTPWSKGVAGTGRLKANSGSFKKGHIPVNHKPIGHERVDKYGYILVKVANENPRDSSNSGHYRGKHNLVWEAKHGPIPEGMCIRFNDGNPQNCAIENLIMVTRGEHIRLTQMQYANQPAELKPAVLGIARVEQALHERQEGVA